MRRINISNLFYEYNSRKSGTTGPSELIVILDIDETLAHTVSSGSTSSGYPNRKLELIDNLYILNILTDRNDGIFTTMWGIKRPHLDNFLNFCFSYFKLVIVWSAGSYEYVHSMVQELFKNTYEPHYILTRNNCVKRDDIYEKPFWKLLKDFPELNNYVDFDSDQRGIKNIVMIDDKSHCFNSDPYNGVLIPEFVPDLENIRSISSDDALLRLIHFFESIRGIGELDIRKIDKKNIFKINPPNTLRSFILSKEILAI